MVRAAGTGAGAPLGQGLRRSVGMFRAFLLEQTDPETFYRTQAEDTAAQIGRYMSLFGARVIDVGGGAGYFTEAFRRRGASSFLVEPEAADPDPEPLGVATDQDAEARQRLAHAWAVRGGRLARGHAVAGDGYRLPFPDGVADLTFSSNVLEHVPDPAPFLSEMARVTRTGGLVYLSYTAWMSPWGGHETSPWHYLGGDLAARRYQRRNGRPPKNLFGQSLFVTHVGPVLRLARARPDLEMVDALPRYYPDWLSWIVRVPGLREIATWNLLLIMRKRARGAA